MSLTSALNIAQNSLLNTQRQVSIVSRNVSEAHNPNYARRSLHMVSLAPGVQGAEVRRATNDALFKQTIGAISGYSAQNSIMDGLDRLAMNVNGVDNASSAASALSKFQDALQLYSGSPHSHSLAASTIESAREVVRSFNEGTKAIQDFRKEMDASINRAVKELNGLLAEFKNVNTEVVNGTRAGRDVSDAFDKRDALLKQISELVPISTIGRADHDMMIVTADGATLFEKIPRTVTFEPTYGYDAATQGNGVQIDGVPVNVGVGGNTTASGSIAAMMQLRDDVTTDMQLQLDEMARALNDAIPGLMLGADPDEPGFAGRVSLNALLDPSQGGNPLLLRDGIPSENDDDDASFNDVLLRYIDEMNAPRTFETASGDVATVSLMNYSADAIGWLEGNRREAASGSDTKAALLMRSEAALSNATNVNIDEEMALLLELETSYAASARILQTIDSMLATLLEVAR